MLEKSCAWADAGTVLGWIRTARGVFRFVASWGIAFVGVGAALLLGGHVFLGLVVAAFGAGALVAVGYWVVPFGEPAWYRRTVRAWRDWGSAVKVAQSTAQRHAAEIADRVAALPVPTRFAAEAPPVVAHFKPDLSKAERSQLEQRLRESAARLQAASAGVDRLEGEALSPEEKAYAEALRKAFDDRLDDAARMYEGSRVACERFAALLSDSSAPAARTKLQEQMKAAVTRYAEVVETARAAAAARGFEALANIGTLLGPVADEMESCRRELAAANPVRRKPTELRPSGS
jgi:hypothetical protein